MIDKPTNHFFWSGDSFSFQDKIEYSKFYFNQSNFKNYHLLLYISVLANFSLSLSESINFSFQVTLQKDFSMSDL